jgi:hypothetical protein
MRENSCLRWIHAVTGRMVNWVKLNGVREVEHGGRHFMVKSRNSFGRHITPLANGFFRFAHVPFRFWMQTRKWQEWEVWCFQRLNPGFTAHVVGGCAVCEEKLPGDTLWNFLKAGTLTRQMLVAAGAELRRAHGLRCAAFGGTEGAALEGEWSHGDAAMRNVMYDAVSGRARLIDFETLHDAAMPAVQRHADDLMAFLLDLASRGSNHLWLSGALGFLRAYGDGEVVDEVVRRLQVPQGPAILWWKIRVNFAETACVARKLKRLRRALVQGDCSIAGARARRRNRCLPSATCQAMTPGTPNAISRARRMSARASAVGASMPSIAPMTT